MPVFVRASRRAKAYTRSSIRTLRNAMGPGKRAEAVRNASVRKGFNARAQRFDEKSVAANFKTSVKGRRIAARSHRLGKGFNPMHKY